MALDVSFLDALRVDTDDALRAVVQDMTGRIMMLSCDRDDARAAAFLQVALDLRALLVNQAEAGSATAAPIDDESTLQARGLDDIARRLGCSVGGAAPDPVSLWDRLHLSCIWLDKATATELRKELHTLASTEPDDAYLVPPWPDRGVAGIEVAAAERHPRLMQALAGWNRERRSGLEPLLSLAGLAMTMVERYTPLYVSPLGSRIKAMSQTGDRDAFGDNLLKQIGRLANPEQGPLDELGWLVQVDGTIRSVFPLPLPAESSWWATRLGRSFGIIEDAVARTGLPAVVKLLKVGTSVDSAEYCQYAGKEDPALATQDGQRPGTVLWPLRAYLAVPEATPGHAPEVRLARVLVGNTDGFWPEAAL